MIKVFSGILAMIFIPVLFWLGFAMLVNSQTGGNPSQCCGFKKEQRIHDTVYMNKCFVQKVTDKATCKLFYRIGMYDAIDSKFRMNIDQYDSAFEKTFSQMNK